MNLKRTVTLSLAVLMLTSALVGCAPKAPAQGGDKTPEEWATAYKTAIEGARPQEDNDAFSIVTNTDETVDEGLLQMMGLTAEDMTAFALSASLINVHAYGIAAIQPAEGKADAVKEGLNTFVTNQQNNFTSYLADQYDIAKAAKVETLDDGTILLVMCADQDTVLAAIKEALK